MTPGLRSFKSASLRVAVPIGIVDEDAGETERMQEGIRELLDVQSGNQRKGHASSLLKSVCTEADVESKVLMVQVNAYSDGMGNEALQKWYARHGFDTIQTEPVLLMARKPE